MNKQSYEEGIASIIKNYRRLELKKPLDLQHVQRWIQQFEPEEQEIVLKETFHALTRYYINEEKIYNFIDQVLESISELLGNKLPEHLKSGGIPSFFRVRP